MRLESPAIRCSRARTVAARARMSCGSALGALGAVGAVRGAGREIGLVGGLLRAAGECGLAGRALGEEAEVQQPIPFARLAGTALPRIDHVLKATQSGQRLVGSRDELAGQPRDVPPARQPPSAQLRAVNLHKQRGKGKAERDHSRHRERWSHTSTLCCRPWSCQENAMNPRLLLCNNRLFCRSDLTSCVLSQVGVGAVAVKDRVRSHSLPVAPRSPLLRVCRQGWTCH